MRFVRISTFIDDVKDFYFISDTGILMSYSNPTNPIQRKFNVDKDGYFVLSLQKFGGGSNHFRISRLVAMAFVSNPNSYPVVNHKDTNKQYNYYTNLEWCTVSYNTQHAYDNNLINHGRKKKIKSINLITGEEKNI